MPGLKGAKVRLVFADHQGKPELGQSEAERLITQEKVIAIIGCWHSGVTATASQVAERYGIPFLNAESSSPGLTRRGLKWFFRTSPHDEHFSQAMFDFYRDFEKKRGVKIKTVGLTYDNSALRRGQRPKIEKELAKKAGLDVVLDLQYKERSTSLQSEVQRLKAANPDVWMPTSYQTDAILFVRTSKELDYNPKMIMAQDAGHVSPDFIQAVGKDAEGTMSRDAVQHGPDRQAAGGRGAERAVLEEARQGPLRFPRPRVHRIHDPARRHQPRRIDRSRGHPAGPRRHQYPGRSAHHDVAGRQVRRDRAEHATSRPSSCSCQGGKYYTVWPFDSATRDVIYPIPAWKDRK